MSPDGLLGCLAGNETTLSLVIVLCTYLCSYVTIILIFSTPMYVGKTLSLRQLKLFKWRDECGDNQQLRIIEAVSNDWRDVAILLGLSVGQMEALWKKYCMNSEDCCLDVFDDWIKKNGESTDYTVTWSGLHELLVDIKHAATAECLKKALQTVGIDIK